MKKRTKLLIYGFIAIIIYMLFQQANLPTSWNSLFHTDPELVQNRTKLLEQLRKQSSILWSTSYNEIVLDTIKPSSSDRLTVLAKAKLETGIDLRLLNEGDIFTEGDSIAIQLPPAELLSIEIDHSGFRTLKQRGNWTNEELIYVKSKAKSQFEENTMRGNMISRAEVRGRTILEDFLRTIGFHKISLF